MDSNGGMSVHRVVLSRPSRRPGRFSLERQLKLNEIASSQHALVLRDQAIDLTFSPKEIRTRLRTKTWLEYAAGLYAIAGAPATFGQQAMAAVLLSGEGALASHRTSAFLRHWIRAMPRSVDVAVLHGTHFRTRRGVHVHQFAVLDPCDADVISGIPVTSAIRTVVDLAARLQGPAYERVLDDVLLRREVSIADLRACIARTGPTRMGMGRLRKLLDDREFGIPESELERVFLRLAKRYKWPRFVRQEKRQRSRVDFAYPELDIVIEVDGRIWHGSAEAFWRDPRRQNDIVLSGTLILRFTWFDLTKDPAYIDRKVREALNRRSLESIRASEGRRWTRTSGKS